MIFRGTFEHALDAKNRLTVPAKYRDGSARRDRAGDLPGDGGGHRPFALDLAAGRLRLVRRSRRWRSSTRSALARADLRNLLYGNSWDQELDSANRLVIPQPAREFAGLEKEVVITGAGDHLQIWDRKAFAEYNAIALSRFSEITASFDHTD